MLNILNPGTSDTTAGAYAVNICCAFYSEFTASFHQPMIYVGISLTWQLSGNESSADTHNCQWRALDRRLVRVQHGLHPGRPAVDGQQGINLYRQLDGKARGPSPDGRRQTAPWNRQCTVYSTVHIHSTLFNYLETLALHLIYKVETNRVVHSSVFEADFDLISSLILILISPFCLSHGVMDFVAKRHQFSDLGRDERGIRCCSWPVHDARNDRSNALPTVRPGQNSSVLMLVGWSWSAKTYTYKFTLLTFHTSVFQQFKYSLNLIPE